MSRPRKTDTLAILTATHERSRQMRAENAARVKQAAIFGSKALGCPPASTLRRPK